MTHLETLDGAPLEWPTLLQRVATYWETHDRYGRVLTPPVVRVRLIGCGRCRMGKHGVCSGHRNMSGRPGNARKVICECSARGHAA